LGLPTDGGGGEFLKNTYFRLTLITLNQNKAAVGGRKVSD